MMAVSDPSTICLNCMKADAMTHGTCRFCGKTPPRDLPVGMLPSGSILSGKYLTGLPLGQGGFGITYQAYDLFRDCTVAIKEYYPREGGWCSRRVGDIKVNVEKQAEFDYGFKHFKGEAEVIRRLSDIPEIVQLYESFNENNTAYYAMELLRGQTLEEYLRSRPKPLSFYETVGLLMPVMLGIESVHQHQTIHRDIKPSNIFICQDGAVKILDFGAAEAEDSVYAVSFMPVISEGYSPPEQFTISSDRVRQGPWCDVYAMAGTVYRCITGSRPPSSSARLAGDNLEFEGTKITAKQKEILEKNLSLRPEKRSQTMLDFAKELLTGLRKNEEQELRSRYAVLQEEKEIKQEKPAPTVMPEPATVAPKKRENGIRPAVAICVDLILSQILPLLVGRYFGLAIPMSLIWGYLIGVLISWVMTFSNARGSPGQLLSGLRVHNADGNKPDALEALLYCMLRMLWPVIPIDLTCKAIAGRTLTESLSGCKSDLRDSEPNIIPRRMPTIRITEGLFAGDVIPLSPGRYVIGRYPDVCNLVFPMTYNVVSRVQCILDVDPGGEVFITNRSSLGTMADGRKLTGENERIQIREGSILSFGREKMILSYEEI